VIGRNQSRPHCRGTHARRRGRALAATITIALAAIVGLRAQKLSPQAERAAISELVSLAAGERLEERHNMPTFNVSGLGSGTVAGQGRTVIPASATADIDMRLVKNIDPARQMARLRAHIEAQGYHLVAGEEPTDQEREAYPKLARLVQFEGYPAGRTPIDQPTANSVISAVAAASESGAPVRYPTLGGAPTIGMPIANYDNNQHGPNENLTFGAYFDAIEAVAAILTMR
jgi:acetylornithine deacetylase/succinyl-diaminopimelate desuccinylase-like protein